MFTVTFNTDNAAFQDGDIESEVSDTLHRITRAILNGAREGRATDANGNAIGWWSLVEAEEAS